MATKTIILRPTSITSNDESLVTLYPTDTMMSNAHMLVNEEIADDDATYITSGLGSRIQYRFTYTRPDDLNNISGFSFTVRHKSEGSDSGTTYTLYLTSNNYVICSTSSGNSAAYSNTSDNITDDIRNSIITEFDNVESSLNFYITQSTATGSSKNKPIRTTQIYVELTYVDNNAVVSYFKQNGTWVKLDNFIMYYKRNHQWTLLNDLQLDLYSNKNYLSEVIE